MSERRFVIFETGADAKDFIEITELELKKRCVRMFNAKWSCAEDIRIDILLDGEQEQPWPGPVDILEIRGKEQPDEWEEWLSRCPTMYLREWFTDMVQILRRKP